MKLSREEIRAKRLAQLRKQLGEQLGEVVRLEAEKFKAEKRLERTKEKIKNLP